MKNKIANRRNSSVELLRIFSMLMIVTSHISFHGFYTDEKYQWISSWVNKWILQWTNMGSLGVDIFVILSGYYLVRSNHVDLRKFSKLLAEVFFYSSLSYLFFIGIGFYDFSPLECLKAFLPFTYGVYWFFTAYLTVYILHPYINRLFIVGVSADESDNPNILNFILILICLWSIPHTFLGADLYAHEICQFLMLYSIGASIRIYGSIFKTPKNRLFLLSLVIIWVCIPLFGMLIGRQLSYFEEHVTYFYSRNSILTIALAYAICVFTLQRDSFYKHSINGIAESVFAVYLITDNYYFREYVYYNILCVRSWASSPMLPIMLLLYALTLFAGAVVIDKVLGGAYLFLGKLVHSVLVLSISKVKLWLHLILLGKN